MTQPRHVLAILHDAAPGELENVFPDGIDVRVAGDSSRALLEATEDPPDLLLIDVDLPRVDGYEVCRRVRANPGLSRCKVILASRHAGRDCQLLAYEAGAHDFVERPFDGPLLAAKARVYLEFRSLEEEAVRMKSELLSLLAHEIRTPLTGVLPPAEMLAADAPMDDEQRRMWADMILDSARRLASLAERGMLLNELRGGTRTLRRERVDLAALALKAANELQRAEPSITVEVEGPRPLGVEVDHSLLRVALTILLENARLFGPPDRRIQVELWEEQGGPRLAVTVSGVADRPALEAALETFAPRLVGDQVVGSDLGLALVRRVFEAHGGRVEVRAEPGVATGFVCELPGVAVTVRGSS